MTTVYISIGNSDDKLTQTEWSTFLAETWGVLEVAVHDAASGTHRNAAAMHGSWYSAPGAPWQNACWCIDLPVRCHDELQAKLKALAGKYRQDSIAWAPALTQFLKPEVTP